MTGPALLLAVAVALLLSRPNVAHRLPSAPSSAGSARPARPTMSSLGPPLCAACGVALVAATRNPVGLALGVLLALAGPRLMARLHERDTAPQLDATALPLALDLLAACLVGGATPAAAVGSVAAVTPGLLGERLTHVASSLSLGVPPAQAFAALGEEGPSGAVARTLRRALDGGTPVAAAVARVAEEARLSAAMAAHARAKRLAVTSIAPLVVCFMPAFFFIGVVPALYGAFVQLFGQIS